MISIILELERGELLGSGLLTVWKITETILRAFALAALKYRAKICTMDPNTYINLKFLLLLWQSIIEIFCGFFQFC